MTLCENVKKIFLYDINKFLSLYYFNFFILIEFTRIQMKITCIIIIDDEFS